VSDAGSVPAMPAATPALVPMALRMTAPQTAYLPQPPMTMPPDRFETTTPAVSEAATVVVHAPLAQTVLTASPIVVSPKPPAPQPGSGSYRLVTPCAPGSDPRQATQLGPEPILRRS